MNISPSRSTGWPEPSNPTSANCAASGVLIGEPAVPAIQTSIHTTSARLCAECAARSIFVMPSSSCFSINADVPSCFSALCTSIAFVRETVQPFCPAMSPGITFGNSKPSRNATCAKSFVENGFSPFAASHQSGSPSPSESPFGARGSVPARNSSRSLIPSASESAAPSCERSPKCSISHSSGRESPSDESPCGRVAVTVMLSAFPAPENSTDESVVAFPRIASPSPTMTPSTYKSQTRAEKSNFNVLRIQRR